MTTNAHLLCKDSLCLQCVSIYTHFIQDKSTNDQSPKPLNDYAFFRTVSTKSAASCNDTAE